MREAFLDDILNNPDDDAPRLVLADWLEEHGDAADRDQAAFIRIQMALVAETVEGPRRWDLVARQEALLARYQAAWAGRLHGLVLHEGYRRGFVEAVTLPAEQFQERADEVFRSTPVRELSLITTNRVGPEEGRGSAPLLGALAASTHLRQVRGLRIEGPLGQDEFVALADSPHLAELHTLELEGHDFAPAALTRLLAAPGLRSLRKIRVRCWADGPRRELVESLTSAAALTRLTDLELLLPSLGGANLSLLAFSPHLPRLEALTVETRTLAPEGLAALRESGMLGRLRTLHLRGEVGRAGTEALLGSGGLDQGPRRLDLQACGLDGGTVTLLARTSMLAGVEELDLRCNTAGDAGLVELARSPHTGRLRVLRLHFNGVGDAGLGAVAESGRLESLAWLDLDANRVTAKGGSALARTARLPALRRVYLRRNGLGGTSVAALRLRFGDDLLV